jgi:glucose PTS system EIICBA or EIICB component
MKFFSILQRIGQSLMMPVSVLPAAGILIALARILKDPGMPPNIQLLGEVMYSGGLAVFEQLPLIFAVGVAIGFTGGAGAAGLAAVVGYLTMANVLKVISEAQHLEMAINTGVFGGILIGLLAATLYNRYHQIRLNPVFGFFSGKRFIPIITALSAFALALGLGILWPPIQAGIFSFGQTVIHSPWGPALYAAGKRLLIPVGLHHVYYPPILFQFGEFVNTAGQIVHGESPRYFAGDPSAGGFMAAEFPIMLFGLPAAALAMYLAARKERRRAIAGVLISAGLTSIVTGITEPIEFAFIFVAPLLYVVHVGLAFLSGFLTHAFDIHLGYTFSASLIDMFLGWFNQKNTFYLLAVVGPLMAALYFVSFYSLIRIFNFKTVGREADDATPDATAAPMPSKGGEDRAWAVLQATGGAENLKTLDACVTRLRLSVDNPKLVDRERLRKLGASGVMQAGSNFQIVFGFESEVIKDQIKKMLSHEQIPSPISGRVLSLSEVPDATFSQKLLGDGFAVMPSEGVVFAPVAGKIETLFPTLHAIGLKSRSGVELLIHVGVDTVQMKGEGFKAFVKQGDWVEPGQKLLEFDMELVRKKAKSLATPILVTNMDHIKSMRVDLTGSNVKPVLDIEV